MMVNASTTLFDSTNDYYDEKNVTNKESKNVDNRDIIEEALNFGFTSVQHLRNVKEPMLYKMGLYLDQDDPAYMVAKFGNQMNQKTQVLAEFGYAAMEARKKIAQRHTSKLSANNILQSRIIPDENCPLRSTKLRCSSFTRYYRNYDGTCNDVGTPTKGSASMPMHRFLKPFYDDTFQSERLSVYGTNLPSARKVSTTLHNDNDKEIKSVTSLFVQWGQFIDHDVTSTAKQSAFNGTIPRCCHKDTSVPLPKELLHPSCMPIEIPKDDYFYSKFKKRCMEFTRSAPSVRINCDVGWREQINQVTSYLDASTIYGNSIDTCDSIRTFRNGKILYGFQNTLLCRSGAVSMDCLQPGDSRADEQPGLVSLHTIFVRYHNIIANTLSKINSHWSDERIFQETRRIIGATIQHITYREFLPIVVGSEVIKLFELDLKKDGYYHHYTRNVAPDVANSFSTAAFRFGHSMVQKSYVRSDINHNALLNNVSLHEESTNEDNIWSFGSLDRLILGLCNQPAQRRDEFITEELTNHLFQQPGSFFGMDLAAINIQRGRDHGLPPYTIWRRPCGLSEVKSWKDLEEVMSKDVVLKLRKLYLHFDDIDLFSGGLSEKPVRGGVVGPTFACIIAQQFSNLRKGDRFWYENAGFESSFTPAQLQQIRGTSLSQILCRTLTEIKSVQPFVFLSHDSYKNVRVTCNSLTSRTFDMAPWIENVDFDDSTNDIRRDMRSSSVKKNNCSSSSTNKVKVKVKNKGNTLKIPVKNITTSTVPIQNRYGNGPTNSYSKPIGIYDNNDDMTYLINYVKYSGTSTSTTTTEEPLQVPLNVNINIQYLVPTTTKKTIQTNKKKRPNLDLKRPPQVVVVTRRPTISTTTRRTTENLGYPIFLQNTNYNDNDRPYYNNKPQIYHDYDYDRRTSTFRPTNFYYYDQISTNNNNGHYYKRTTTRPSYFDQYVYNKNDNIDEVYGQTLNNQNDRVDKVPRPNKIYAIGHVEKVQKMPQLTEVNDKLDFRSRLTHYTQRIYDRDQDNRFVKVSSVKSGGFVENRENTDDILVPNVRNVKKSVRKVRLVDLEVIPSEISKSKWKIYNVTENILNISQDMPQLNNNEESSEIPKPMKVF